MPAYTPKEKWITLTREQIQMNIPYALICETQQGARWHTKRRLASFRAAFTEEERTAARRLFKLAYDWHLVKGVPESVRMSSFITKLWLKLGDYCASL